MAVTRQLIFGIDPYTNEQYINTFSFADVPDSNALSKAFTCGLVPNSRTSGVSLMQESVFLGTTSAVGVTYQAYKDTIGTDGTTGVTATAVFQRIDPEARADVPAMRAARQVTQKRFLSLDFASPTTYQDDVQVSYCQDGDPTTGDPITWKDFLGTIGDTKLSFDGCRANFIYIRVIDTSVRYNVLGVTPFSIEYISDGEEREGGNE